MKRSVVFATALAAVALVTCGQTKTPVSWRELEPGLGYAKVALSGADTSARIHLFKADLSTWKPVALDAKTLTGKQHAHASELAAKADVPIAVNATFFDEKGAALGLVQGDAGTVFNPLRSADWGVLAVKGSAGTLVHTKEFTADPALDFAVQCGPRAVVAGKPTKLKAQGASARTGLCLTAPGTLVVLATEGRLTAAELAVFLAEPVAKGGLGCTDALLLDGGPSTQLWAKAGDLALDVRGGWPVPNGVGLTRR